MRIKDRANRDKALDIIEEELKAIQKEAGGLANLAKLVQGKNPPDKMIGKAIGDVFFGMVMPAYRPPQKAYDRTEQIHRNLQVAFALAAYHSDNRLYPAKLDELAPKYLAVVPDDLYSGKALIYRPSEKGYLFYSVGINGKDEGGRSRDDDPPGGNLPVRMPLPELKAKK